MCNYLYVASTKNMGDTETDWQVIKKNKKNITTMDRKRAHTNLKTDLLINIQKNVGNYLIKIFMVGSHEIFCFH